MKINPCVLKAIELKLAEYAEANGTIAEHESANTNYCACRGSCSGGCTGTMNTGCGSCQHACYGACHGTCDKTAY